MRKYILPGSVLMMIVWTAILFCQPKEITIEEIAKNPAAFNNTAVEIEGIITQYVPSASSAAGYYMINGEYGGTVKVNTSSKAPELFKRYRVNGTVYIDPLSREAFISERTRNSLEPPAASTASEGTDPLVILLGIMFLLLAAIFVYTQIVKRRERNYEEEMIYTLPLTPVSETMHLPDTPIAEKPREKPRMEPIVEKPFPPADRPRPAMEQPHHVINMPPAAAVNQAPERSQPPERSQAPEKNPAHEKQSSAPSFDSDFRTIKIVPSAPQTITFIPGSLEIISGDDTGKSFRIAGYPTAEGSVVSIGREVVTGDRAYAHIQLNEKFRTVSRRQAELIYKDHKLFVRNLSQTNLTQVDGVELKPGECAELKPDAKIRTGELEFQYKIN